MKTFYKIGTFFAVFFSLSFSAFSLELQGDVAAEIGNGFKVVWQGSDKTCLFYGGENTNICMTAAEIKEGNKKAEGNGIDVCKDVIDYLKASDIKNLDCIKGYLVYWTYFFNYENRATKKNGQYFFQIKKGYDASKSMVYVSSAKGSATIRGIMVNQVVNSGEYVYVGSSNNSNRCNYFIERIHTKTLRVEMLFDGEAYCNKNLINSQNEVRFPRFQILPDKSLVLMITENTLKDTIIDPTKMYVNKVRRVVIK